MAPLDLGDVRPRPHREDLGEYYQCDDGKQNRRRALGLDLNESSFGVVFIFCFLISDESPGSGPLSQGGLNIRPGIR